MTYYKFEQNMLCFQFYSDRCRKTYPYFALFNFLFHLPGNEGRGEEELLQRENGRHRKGEEEEEEPAGNDSRADRERRMELQISGIFYKKGKLITSVTVFGKMYCWENQRNFMAVEGANEKPDLSVLVAVLPAFRPTRQRAHQASWNSCDQI